MKRDVKLFLKDIIEACNYIQEFVEGMTFDQFKDDEKTVSAVIRKFEVIGEAVKNVPEPIRKQYSKIPWKNIAGMRDALIHGYFGVDYFLVWETIETNIPEIIPQVLQILDDLKSD